MTITETPNLGLKNPDVNEKFRTEEIYNYNNNIIDEFAGSAGGSSGIYSPAPARTFGTGSAYTATIQEWNGLTGYSEIAGIPFTIVLHQGTASTSASININGWGTVVMALETQYPSESFVNIKPDWAQAGNSIRLFYDGSRMRIMSTSSVPLGGALVSTPWSGRAIGNAFLLRDRISLASADDLNVYSGVIGNYSVYSDTTARQWANIPKGLYYAFWFTNAYSGNNNYPYQILGDRFGTVWVRPASSSATNTGSKWIMIACCGSALVGLSYTIKDLNEINEQGRYNVYANASNTPSGAGILESNILGFAGSGQIIRHTFYSSTADRVYTRISRNDGGVWTDWELQPSRAEINDINSRVLILENS